MTKGSAVAEANRLVAFINTLHRPDGDDVLADERASAWLADWLGLGIPERVALVDQGSLAGLRTLREGLRQLAAANNGQNPDGRTVLDAATVLQSKPLVVELGDDQQGPRLVAQADADAAGPGIAAAAGYYFAVRAANAWPRVKACAAPDCRWAYLDTSRNRSRRWCDMADCGNRAKNRTWRQRQRVAEDRLATSA
ncbi:MAG: CGNR zinc finger domain-containing protein [Pseudonocardiaceae bacterium]